ncbi:Heme oxygenase, putative [Pediculus humanus corporis]|uniref:Heme oxygenase n=1 Tax=Pediculus humanus subsp. corporis TaxID=121224 RepID=E0VSF5_PEDHC|nr:Heme oxygenase, putative [Pediculus humanus corporis]EEB16311.1 Heme oxygenase, putative [Pediculus humanus corporis]
MSDELFTVTMRKAVKKVHAITDSMVNAKFVFALNDDSVWSQALLLFYEVFKFLEIQMKENSNGYLGSLYSEDMSRTEAFENDLKFFLGDNWKENYVLDKSVKNYIQHLETLTKTDPDLLMAYVYHLYMGLLSGGQILQKKREFQAKITGRKDKLGTAVTTFENVKISDVKANLKNKINEIAKNLDENKKELLIKESIKVFELNMTLIEAVKGTKYVAIKNIFLLFSFLAPIIGITMYFYWKKS